MIMKTYKTTVLILVPALLLLSSCTREEVIDSNAWKRQSDHICFGISPKTENVLTKGGSDHLVMRSADSDDTLCVRVTVSDGIDGQPFAEKAPGTRAAQITSIGEYGGFHVQAHSYTGLTLDDEFYINDDVTIQNDNIWSTALMYFWPGTGRTLDFYAWAPADAGNYGLTAPSHPNETTLEYTVPSDVNEQKDISVATATDMAGNSYSAVPLTFNHIFTAVRFVIGDQMQPGTIERVALTGVYDRGTYDMAAAEGSNPWELGATVADFSQLMTFPTTGNETYGEAITSNEGTFMMLPQTLPDGAEIQIVFLDNATGTKRTLSTSIAGMEWPQGTTVTYRISITPEYEFNLSDERTLDAHYEIYKTNLVVSGVPSGQSWTISAPDNVTIQAQSDMNSWAQQGYWTEKRQETDAAGNLTDIGSARGEASYSGTGSGDFPIAIFVPENIGDEKRSIALSVTVNGSVVQTINIEQYAPSWYGSNIGCERLEGDMQPWGFYWSSDFKLVFDLTNCDENDRQSLATYVNFYQSFIIRLIAFLIGIDIPDLSYVKMDTHGGFLGIGEVADKITINLGSLDAGNIAESQDDGQRNTRDIYNFEGIQLTNNIINRIQSVGGYTDDMMNIEGSGSLPTNNAAIACMKLNSWNVVTAQGEEVLTLTNGTLPEWYLPASGEITGISDDEYPLSGNYWTSTSVQNSHEEAYKYDAGGTISSERRDTELNVRAVRKR